MAMIRVAELRELGGYTTELTLYGWEDYDLWCRMAERGMRGVHVPEILAAYRESYTGMAWSISNISTTGRLPRADRPLAARNGGGHPAPVRRAADSADLDSRR